MQKKSFRLSIIALLLFIVLVLVSCGFSSKEGRNNTTLQSSKSVTDDSITRTSKNEQLRFTCEEITIMDTKNSESYFKSSFIVTDNQTGKQYLYVFRQDGYSGGPAMIELDSTVEPTYNVK